MSKRKIPACVEHYRREHGWHDGHQGRWRQQKRFFRKQGMSDPVYEAWLLGDVMSLAAILRRYPEGRRRQEALRGLRRG